MKKYLILFACFICLTVISAFVRGSKKVRISTISTEWILAKDINNVKVFTRQSEESKIKEFKAITTVTANMRALETLIENVESYPNWQANIATAKILKQADKATKYIYYTTEVPWPIANRDVVICSEKVQSINGTIAYNLSSKWDYIEEQKDFTRMKIVKGIWQLTPQGNNKIEVIYQFYGDPAGTIPGWIINVFIVDGPYTTLFNLKKIVEKQTSK
jgi:hypothetical protein